MLELISMYMSEVLLGEEIESFVVGQEWSYQYQVHFGTGMSLEAVKVELFYFIYCIKFIQHSKLSSKSCWIGTEHCSVAHQLIVGLIFNFERISFSHYCLGPTENAGVFLESPPQLSLPLGQKKGTVNLEIAIALTVAFGLHTHCGMVFCYWFLHLSGDGFWNVVIPMCSYSKLLLSTWHH